MALTGRVRISLGTAALLEVGEGRAKDQDALAGDVRPEWLATGERAGHLLLGDLDHLDSISREPSHTGSPGPDVLPPSHVVLVDRAWPDDDHVDVALAVGLTAGKGTEDDDAGRLALEVIHGRSHLDEYRLTRTRQRRDGPRCDVVGHESEQRRGRSFATLHDTKCDKHRHDAGGVRQAHPREPSDAAEVELGRGFSQDGEDAALGAGDQGLNRSHEVHGPSLPRAAHEWNGCAFGELYSFAPRWVGETAKPEASLVDGSSAEGPLWRDAITASLCELGVWRSSLTGSGLGVAPQVCDLGVAALALVRRLAWAEACHPPVQDLLRRVAERSSSERDEVASWFPGGRGALEAQNETTVERVGDSQEGVEVGAVAAALDAGDLRVARPDQVGELLLTEALVHAVLDQKPRDLTGACQRSLLPAVLLTAGGPSG